MQARRRAGVKFLGPQSPLRKKRLSACLRIRCKQISVMITTTLEQFKRGMPVSRMWTQDIKATIQLTNMPYVSIARESSVRPSSLVPNLFSIPIPWILPPLAQPLPFAALHFPFLLFIMPTHTPKHLSWRRSSVDSRMHTSAGWANMFSKGTRTSRPWKMHYAVNLARPPKATGTVKV